MLQKKTDLIKKLIKMPLDEDADIRISILGLAYCQLTPGKSQVNFLSHVPHHKLDLMIYQRRYRKEIPSLLLDVRVDINHTISIQADNSISPNKIEVGGAHHLSELINISQLHHKGKVIKYRKNIPANRIPIKLMIYDCGFYTQLMTENAFDIIETDEGEDDVKVESKPIGYVMGGKIRCRDGGNLEVQVKGSNPLNIARPLKDMDGDYFYDIILNNHCVDLPKCKGELGNESDFKYYYDLLADADKETRKFKLQKAANKGTDVAACNVVVTEPPSWSNL